MVEASGAFDFGECRQGDVLTHVFRLVNSSQGPIEIVQLMTSCGCVVVEGDRHLIEAPIAPDAAVEIPIQFTVRGLQDAVSARVEVLFRPARRIAATARSDGAALDRLSLRVSATVRRDYVLSPSQLDFGEIDGLMDQKITRTIRVIPEALDQVEIDDFRSSNDWIAAKRVADSGNPKTHQIEVTLDVSNVVNSRSVVGYLTLVTNSQRLPQAMVPISARYRSPVNCEPVALVIGSDRQGVAQEEIHISTSRASRIRDIVCKPAVIRAELISAEPSQIHTLRVQVPRPQTESLEGVVQFEAVLVSEDSERVVRTLSVPVFRFCSLKEVKP